MHRKSKDVHDDGETTQQQIKVISGFNIGFDFVICRLKLRSNICSHCRMKMKNLSDGTIKLLKVAVCRSIRFKVKK